MTFDATEEERQAVRLLRAMGVERDHAAGQMAIVVERLRGMDRADELLAEGLRSVPSALTREIEHLRELTDARFEGLDRALKIADAEGEKAQHKFERTVEARFAQVNEFRSALDDLGKQMATRRELESSGATSQGRYEDIQKQLQELRSRLDTGPADLRTLQQRIDTSEGRGEGVVRGRTEARAGITFAQGLVATGLGIVGLLLAVLTYNSKHAPPTVVTQTVPTVVTVPAK